MMELRWLIGGLMLGLIYAVDYKLNFIYQVVYFTTICLLWGSLLPYLGMVYYVTKRDIRL